MNKIEPFVAYEASAGSGKTFALSVRYISLLLLGADPKTILTLTFTNKAANEMKTRIEGILKNLENKNSELNEISKITGITKKDIFQKKENIYKKFLQSDIQILTIDKFCTSILRKFSLYLGLFPDFTIEQKSETEKFISLFIKALLQSKNYQEFVQFAVFEDKKLNSVFQILGYFYEKNINDSLKKKSVQFDKKKILENFKKLKDAFYLCDKLSNSAKKALDATTIEEIYLKGWFEKNSLKEYSYFKKCFKDEMDCYFLKLKEEIEKYFLFREAKYINDLIEFFKLYDKTNLSFKRNINDISFGDITNFTYKILSNEINQDFFYFRLDSKVDHILIDEFQDTSIFQYNILKPLFDEIVSGVGAKNFKTLFYVGDIKQSIYRFRGGSKELFFDVAKRYGLTIKRLNKNYRSKKEIVDFVNMVFRDKIKGYFDQETYDKNNDFNGFVKVVIDDEIVKNIISTLKKLFENGIRGEDIAILTYTNDDTLMLESEIKKEFKDIKIVTWMSSLIKNDFEVKAIIEAMKYIYFQEELYKKNFLTLIGLSFEDDIDLCFLDKSIAPCVFVKRMIDRFGFGNRAVLEFLQNCYNYQDLESFLFSIEDFKIEIPQKEIKALKILTIHKSKGLEFKHLLVCDRLKKNVHDRSSFILVEKDLEIDNIYLKIKKREFLDKKYALALENEKKLQQEDAINAKYVAFTRAKESLFVFKKQKYSSFEDLDLTENSFGKFPKGDKKEILENIEEQFVYQDFKVGKQEIIKKEKDDNIQEDLKSINFGLALHYMLEMLNNFEINSIDNAFIAMKNRFLEVLDIESLNNIKNRIQNLLKDKIFLTMIKDKHIYKELPFLYNNKLRQVDLLLEDKNGYIVIDYKSSNFPQKEHFLQVQEYKQALSDIKNFKVKAYLCYVKDQMIDFIEV